MIFVVYLCASLLLVVCLRNVDLTKLAKKFLSTQEAPDEIGPTELPQFSPCDQLASNMESGEVQSLDSTDALVEIVPGKALLDAGSLSEIAASINTFDGRLSMAAPVMPYFAGR